MAAAAILLGLLSSLLVDYGLGFRCLCTLCHVPFLPFTTYPSVLHYDHTSFRLHLCHRLSDAHYITDQVALSYNTDFDSHRRTGSFVYNTIPCLKNVGVTIGRTCAPPLSLDAP